MSGSRTTRIAKQKRNGPIVRLRANAESLRHIALRAPMPKGTKNRLHAMADNIDRILDEVEGAERDPPIRWTKNEVDYCLEVRKPIDGVHSVVSTVPGLYLAGRDLSLLLADAPLAVAMLRDHNGHEGDP